MTNYLDPSLASSTRSTSPTSPVPSCLIRLNCDSFSSPFFECAARSARIVGSCTVSDRHAHWEMPLLSSRALASLAQIVWCAGQRWRVDLIHAAGSLRTCALCGFSRVGPALMVCQGFCEPQPDAPICRFAADRIAVLAAVLWLTTPCVSRWSVAVLAAVTSTCMLPAA